MTLKFNSLNGEETNNAPPSRYKLRNYIITDERYLGLRLTLILPFHHLSIIFASR